MNFFSTLVRDEGVKKPAPVCAISRLLGLFPSCWSRSFAKSISRRSDGCGPDKLRVVILNGITEWGRWVDRPDEKLLPSLHQLRLVTDRDDGGIAVTCIHF